MRETQPATVLADRLRERRHQLFVGREAERDLFRRLLEARGPRVLYIHGHGGIGKTALLHELLHLCREEGVAALRLDGGQIQPDPSALLSSLAELTERPIAALGDLSGLRARVLMFDTFEELAPIDAWFRDSFLPALPDDVLVVLAGREPPSNGWRGDAGWHLLLERIALEELSPEESADYLERRGVPRSAQAAALRFARGHALALSLVADVCEQGPPRFADGGTPDVVHALVEQLVRGLPDEAQRHALEACAVARTTTEPLLAAMLDSGEGHGLFEWLRGLSFMQNDRVGLYPHDLARKALVTDLGFRDPERLRRLNERALTHLVGMSSSASASEWRSAAIDCMYAVFQLLPPGLRTLLRDRRVRGFSPEAATVRDVPALIALVERHEGRASAEIAAHWLAKQLANVTVIRDGGAEPAGLFAVVGLERLSDEDLRIDPAVAAAARHMGKQLAPGRAASMIRFWLARDTYQDPSPVQALCASLVNQHHVSWPHLAFSFLPFSQPDRYRELATLGGFHRESSLDFEIGGRRYGVYAHDWRRVPPLKFLAHLVQTGGPPADDAAPPLGAEAFADAVRLALKHYREPHQLADNPLLATRMVTARASAAPASRVEALRALLAESIATLAATPRSRKLHSALSAGFIDVVGTQEQTAEALDLPLSTYRRHLSEGIAAVLEILWQREQEA